METQQTIGSVKTKLNIGFFFLSLGVLITLITSVVSFLNLIFATLDKRFPDVLNSTYQYGYSTYDYESIRMALATLIIFFPVFLVISFYWRKYGEGLMSHVDEVVRKWVIYIILFMSSLVVVIDLVTLVKYFVSGEVTSRFILKVVAALVVATFVGVYYMFELTNRKKFLGMPVGVWAVAKSSLLVIFLIGYSFSIAGSPTTQRLLRLDDRRVSDLQNIQYQVINHWQQKEKLPATIAELSNPLTGYSLPVDPEFEKGLSYEYIVKDAMSFELCATFARPIPKGWREYSNGGVMPMYPEKDIAVSSYPYPGGGVNESWSHEAGRTCFTRTIDKDIYPPFKNQ
ncbi:MAG: DUF5671 domain-containing protein [Patescibacteria group bacterium]